MDRITMDDRREGCETPMESRNERKVRKLEDEYELAKMIADVVEVYLRKSPDVDLCKTRQIAEMMVNNW